MKIKVFSKRHPKAGAALKLSQSVRQRLWYAVKTHDPYGEDINYTLLWHELPDMLMKEHGWTELRKYKGSIDEWEKVSIEGFFVGGIPRFVFDALELYHELLAAVEPYRNVQPNSAGFLRDMNEIFDDSNLPWRMVDGRFVQLDSKFLEEEVLDKAHALLRQLKFEGAVQEFLAARSDLVSEDYKGAMQNANLALESTMKSVLGISEKIKPGRLIRRLIDSGLVPEYHSGFLAAFEEHILRSVPAARNDEKGVGHGQGAEVNQPPRSLAKLAVHLSGVLILYLVERYLELNPQPEPEPREGQAQEHTFNVEDDIPF